MSCTHIDFHFFDWLQIASMLSSVRDTINLVKEQFEQISDSKKKSSKEPNRNKEGPSWTDDEINELLGIISGKAEQVEGNLVFNLASGRRFLPFDNHTVQNIPKRKYFRCNLGILCCKELT
jgi:hypothetical protein